MNVPSVTDVLLAIAESGREASIELAHACAAANPDDELATRLARFVGDRATSDVYSTPVGFSEFIDNASNPPLYDATIAAIRGVHESVRPRSVLDVGSGDARVTASVMTAATTDVTLLEPSGELMNRALARPDWPTQPRSVEAELERFVADLGRRDHYDLAQSTFAMHSVPSDRRVHALERLRGHVGRFVVVEFDVDAFGDRTREHAEYCETRYRAALAEYELFPAAIDEFLMPILVAQFDPSGERVTYEQPAAEWASEFASAGYVVTVRPIHDYWWATAFLLDAAPR